MKATLIYCAASNREYAKIALDSGMEYGARLPNMVYFDPLFVDQDYEHPNRPAYMAELAQRKPRLATVIDWQDGVELAEVLAWAEDAAQYAQEAVIIVPKVHASVHLLPRTIGGKEVRLGYSVPTSYGGTNLMLWEFAGWPVHLLGGNPVLQLKLAKYLDVRSADGNYIHRKIKYGQFFDGQRWRQLRDAGCEAQGKDIPTAVLSLSFPNMVKAWSLA